MQTQPNWLHLKELDENELKANERKVDEEREIERESEIEFVSVLLLHKDKMKLWQIIRK